MRAWVDAVLARDASGLVAALLLGALALAARGSAAALPVGAVALVLALGSLRHLLAVRATMRRHPPPGRRVDVGGWSMHVLAEGPVEAGRPTLVWFAGAHAGGLSIRHLHDALRGHTRSVLIDRAGAGWSDPGPFPRSTAREAVECLRALDAAGERGPFVFIGHSFGGLLAANMARRRLEATAALVLLDATPPDTIVYGPRQAGLRALGRQTWLTGVLRLVGVHQRAHERAHERAQDRPVADSAWERALGGALQVDRALGVRSRGFIATASIFAELQPEGMAAAAWETAVYDGDLGDLPLYLVAPDRVEPELPQLQEYAAAGPAERERIARVIARTRERYLAASSRARRIVTPAGTSHVFPYEDPDFVVRLVRDIVDGLAPPCAAATRCAS
ncbi:MAG: alpha/beta hydrolase [Rubrivivax sp.]